MSNEGGPEHRSPIDRGSRSAIEVCDAFERAWQRGERPDIRQLMASVSQQEQRPLLFGLLAREVNHRRAAGESISIQHYRSLLPDDPELVTAVFLQPDQIRTLLLRCGYELVERIESGRTGDVYRVLDRREQRLSAVKIVPAFLVRRDAVDTERVINLDYLLHKQIARPTELVEADGNLLLFNEYVEGMNFGQLVEEFGAVGPGVACELACQVAEGLQQLHGHGNVHGALTPTTLVVATDNEEAGIVKLGSVGLTDVADLTLSRFAQSQLQTEYDWRLFAAPEIADRPGTTDPRSDIYSLGCIVRFLLTSQRPPSSQSCESKEQIRVLWKRAALPERRQNSPPELWDIIDRMMSAELASRPASASEVIKLLSPFRDPAALQKLLPDIVASVGQRQRLTGGVRIAGPAGPDEAVTPLQGESAAPPTPRSPESPCHEPPASSWWKRRSTISTIALLALLAAALLLFRTYSRWRSAAAAEATLVEYTGDSGLAWFDEIPWYTPGMRLELARTWRSVNSQQWSATQTWVDSRDDVNAAAGETTRSELKELVESALESAKGPEATVATELCDLANQQHLTVDQLRLEYARLARLLTNPDHATEFHLRGLLRQASGDESKAAADFQSALDLYRRTGSSLLPVCACDFARLADGAPQVDTDPVALLKHDALPTAQSVPLQIRLHCYLARALRTHAGQLQAAQEAAQAAAELADQAGLEVANVLRCEIAEEQAWIALDQWQLPRAQALFEQAIRMREQLAMESSVGCWQHMADDICGLAQTAHLLGDPQQAADLISGLLAVTDPALHSDALLVVSSRRASELRRLRPRLLTSMGDICLTGTDYDYARACESFQQALQSGIDARLPPCELIQIRYQLALATVLSGRVDEAGAELASADALTNQVLGASRVSDWHAVPTDRSGDLPLEMLLRRRALAHAAKELNAQDAERQRQACEVLEKLVQSDALDTQGALNRFLAAQILLELAPNDPQRVARVVPGIAKLIQHCTASLEMGQQQWFRRYARIAHYAGMAAQPALESEAIQTKLDDSIAVLEKAHRVYPKTPGTAPTRPAATSRLHTMAVGLSHYEHHSADQPLNLVSAHNDAEALDKAFNLLRRIDVDGNQNPVGIYAPSPLTRLLTDELATRDAILQFIEDLRLLPAADLRKDLVIISLSGHGLQDLDGSLYFLPYDYEPGRLLSTGLSIDLFQSKLRMLGANVLLIIDTCYSGAAAQGAAAVTVVTRSTQQDVEMALRRMAESETALAVLVAGRAREKAGESRLFGGHGALTAAVLEFLIQRQFDVETKNGVRPVSLHTGADRTLLTLEDLRRYVVDRVGQFPMIDQRPSLYASGDRIGDYWCGDIPLRFLGDAESQPARSESDDETGTP